MPVSSGVIVSHLNDLLRQSGQPVITLTWSDFFNISSRHRLKRAAEEQIANDAFTKYQLFVGFGHNAVIVCHDRNFQPATID